MIGLQNSYITRYYSSDFVKISSMSTAKEKLHVTRPRLYAN
ncbi:hypothetical protein I3843_16G088800 [Carya illinoinensis]|nr:hypothetical protein I3843_16G088800 [Carya illinoinensis]